MDWRLDRIFLMENGTKVLKLFLSPMTPGMGTMMEIFLHLSVCVSLRNPASGSGTISK